MQRARWFMCSASPRERGTKVLACSDDMSKPVWTRWWAPARRGAHSVKSLLPEWQRGNYRVPGFIAISPRIGHQHKCSCPCGASLPVACMVRACGVALTSHRGRGPLAPHDGVDPHHALRRACKSYLCQAAAGQVLPPNVRFSWLTKSFGIRANNLQQSFHGAPKPEAFSWS